MRFVGIDLAADPARTGFALLCGDRRCVLERVQVGAEDESIIEAIRTAQRAGVDVPLGWPESFVDLVREHAAGALPPPETTGTAVAARHGDARYRPWGPPSDRTDWNGYQNLCIADDNALDAALAAVIAREVERDRCVPSPDELRDVASREGDLAAAVGPASTSPVPSRGHHSAPAPGTWPSGGSLIRC